MAKIECNNTIVIPQILNGLQWPFVQDLFCILIQAENGRLIDAEETGFYFIFTLHLLLDEEEGDAVRVKGSCCLCVQRLRINVLDGRMFLMFGN